MLGKKGLWASMREAGRRRKDRGDSGTPERGVLRARGERIKWAKQRSAQARRGSRGARRGLLGRAIRGG